MGFFGAAIKFKMTRSKVLPLMAICALSLAGCETLYEIAEVYAEESANQQTYTNSSTYTPASTSTSTSTSTYNGYTPNSSSSSGTSYNQCSTNCANTRRASLSSCSSTFIPSYENREKSIARCETRAHQSYATCVKRCS